MADIMKNGSALKINTCILLICGTPTVGPFNNKLIKSHYINLLTLEKATGKLKPKTEFNIFKLYILKLVEWECKLIRTNAIIKTIVW